MRRRDIFRKWNFQRGQHFLGVGRSVFGIATACPQGNVVESLQRGAAGHIAGTLAQLREMLVWTDGLTPPENAEPSWESL